MVFSIIPTEISLMGRNLQNEICWSKNWISAPKTSKKHNLQKWTLFSSISNSFRDMSNSLNSPVSHVVKITSQIPVYLQTENLFTVWKTAQKLKKHDFRFQNFKKKHILKIKGHFRLIFLSAPTKCQQPVRTSLPFLPSGSCESHTPTSAQSEGCTYSLHLNTTV